MFFPWILCSMLTITLLIAITKIIILKKSMDEICTEFQRIITEDTNVQISIS